MAKSLDDRQCPAPSQTLLNQTCSSYSSAEDVVAQIIQSLYSAVAKADCDLANTCNYPPSYIPSDGDKFDFIVVGAGSAGSTVANRLSEDGNYTVLLVEAGGDPTKTSEVPALAPYLQNTTLDWQHMTEQGENCCLGMKDNQCFFPRGKVLGGSSILNYMMYVRGNRKDFDKWAEEGNDGWGYEDVLPYFKKSEDMRIKEIRAMPEFSKYHGVGGDLKIELFENDAYKDIWLSFADGLKELGYYQNPDYNGKNQSGFFQLQATLQDGRRCSTAKAFLTPAKGRKNFKILKHSLVTKILIDKTTNTALGIQLVTKDEKTISIYCTKEVIISAGAINSPQLLMLSGVGPSAHLKKFNITVIKDLPVGKNFVDHPLTMGLVLSLNYSLPSTIQTDEMLKLLLKGKSSLSGMGITSLNGFLSTENNVDYPNVQLFMQDYDKNISTLPDILRLYNYKEEVVKKYIDLNAESYNIHVRGAVLRPYSTGEILLKSTNPNESPKIFLGYFSDERDVNTLYDFVEFVSKLTKTEGLSRYDAKLTEIVPPGCESFEIGSRKFRECSLRHLTNTVYHPCGTCRMGVLNSSRSVVDPELRVIGVDRLRVCDASVMPNIVSANLNAATIMIAEKGSDMIKKTWFKSI